MAFMGHKGGESSVEQLEKADSLQPPSSVEEPSDVSTEGLSLSASEQTVSTDKEGGAPISRDGDAAESTSNVLREHGDAEPDSHLLSVESETVPSVSGNRETSDSVQAFQQEDVTELESTEESESVESKLVDSSVIEQVENSYLPLPNESHRAIELQDGQDEQETDSEQFVERASSGLVDAFDGKEVTEPETSDSSSNGIVKAN